MSNRWWTPTYEAPSLSEIFGGTTAYFPLEYLDVGVGLSVDALNLIDPWFQLAVFEDGRRVTGRFQGHGWQG